MKGGGEREFYYREIRGKGELKKARNIRKWGVGEVMRRGGEIVRFPLLSLSTTYVSKRLRGTKGEAAKRFSSLGVRRASGQGKKRGKVTRIRFYG